MPISLQVAKKKREERKTIVDQMNALIPADGNMTAEALTKHTELDAAQNKLKSEIDAIEKSDTLENEMKARLERRATETDRSADELSEEARNEIAIHNHWMRRGTAGMSPEQQAFAAGRIGGFKNAQGTVDGTEGGYLIPETMADAITSAEKYEGGMIDDGVATVISSSTGAQINYPTDNDTNNEGEIVNENTTTDEQDVKFGTVGVNAHLFSSKMILVPMSLLQDSEFDLNAFIAKKFGMRLGRAENRQFTLGTGASAPKGIINAAKVGWTTAAGQPTSIITQDLFQLEHSVDPAYRKNARFMFPDSVLKAIKMLVDGVGRPLWLSGIAIKEPDTINGYAYTINTKMADMAANSKSLAFGDFSYYTIRRVKGAVMLRLTERYAEKGQVAFLSFERADGQLIDAGTNPVKLMQQAAE